MISFFFSGIFLWPGHGHLFCNYKNGTKGSTEKLGSKNSELRKYLKMGNT